MRKTMFVTLISLISISCLTLAQDIKQKGHVAISKSDIMIIYSGLKGDSIVNFKGTEQLPQFPGGEAELYEFINLNLKYPNSDIDVKGNVTCRFILNADGLVSSPEVIRTLDTECDKEVIRVLKLLPKYKPSKHKSKNLRAWYTLKITFEPE